MADKEDVTDDGAPADGGPKRRAGQAAEKKSGETEEKVATKEADEIEAAQERLRSARENLSLLSSPIRTVSLLIQFLASFTVKTTVKVLRSLTMWLLVVPLVAAWVGAHVYMPQLFTEPVCGVSEAGPLWWVELLITEAAWWIILGVLSSVGFGTGLHSGMMFLFPHVLQVVTAAEVCHTTSGLIAWYNHPCKLDCASTYGPKDDSTVTFLSLWSLVTVQCMLWGLGTAIGELPPYLISKTARSTGRSDSDFEAEKKEAREKQDVFSKMKVWTIEFTEKHGFVGVLLLASWPNAAFDMCGMCCGYILMDFWTFFVATAIGKGVIKVNFQAIAFVNLFGSNFFQIIVAGMDSINGALQSALGKDLQLKNLVVQTRMKLVRQFEYQSRFQPERMFREKSSLDISALKELYAKQDDSAEIAGRVMKTWDANHDGSLTLSELQHAASRTDGKVSLSSLDPGAGTSIFKICWELFIVGLVLFFAVSVINELARQKQLELDDAEIETLKQKSKKD